MQAIRVDTMASVDHLSQDVSPVLLGALLVLIHLNVLVAYLAAIGLRLELRSESLLLARVVKV